MELRDGRQYIAEVRALIEEYTRALGLDLSFQNLAGELADPAEKYAPPHGQSLVALEGEQVVGMVAWHWLDEERGEVKRLYVRPDARGKGTAARLMEGIIASARECGCRELVLDTLNSLTAACHLYARLGFEECEAYYHNPLEDVVYMRLRLGD